ncbi:polysaccharide pyruvyl transferase family protein [Ancylobacter sp. Lp-2]|uniref:polysaccharide pyruvyl transferase family protein n=1 Tax=Ancylobacter sp. Lp-2 TaxID=2881339 RepID=UPI001E4A0DD3|nr:polysaccharide pyruvyl transferase family protein [Ancylobacter sp. Lp-2]MCB4770827.1 polysaccharide pyruvyl transferase family protein [Ancylobacter sp. Lp-2]
MENHAPLSINFWKQGEEIGNFGDSLTLLYMDRIFEARSRFSFGALYLVGSVIEDKRIWRASANGYEKGDGFGQAIFWGCGQRTEQPLMPALALRAIVLGARGTLTRDVLGLPRGTPLGDSALILPQFYRPNVDPATSGKVLWVPHIHHRDPTPKDLDGCPDAVVLRPTIPNTVEACERFIDSIVSARFVMANAMHAAVIALAYGVPFSFWGGYQIDLPFKWRDLTSPLDFQMAFQPTYQTGLAEFERLRPDRAFKGFDMEPMLKVAPLKRR